VSGFDGRYVSNTLNKKNKMAYWNAGSNTLTFDFSLGYNVLRFRPGANQTTGIDINDVTAALVAFPSMTRVEFDSEITEIKADAFRNQTNLTEFYFHPNSQLRRIGGYAFAGCRKLVQLDLSQCTLLPSIDDGVFSGGVGHDLPEDVYLEAIFPYSLRTFGKGSFSGAKLKWLHIPEGYSSPYFHSMVFKGCMHLESVSLPSFKTNHAYNDMDSLSYGLFANTPKLKTVTCHKDTVRAFMAFTQNLFVHSTVPNDPDPVGYIAKQTVDDPLVLISASQAAGTTVLFPFTNGDRGHFGLDAHKNMYENTFKHVLEYLNPVTPDELDRLAEVARRKEDERLAEVDRMNQVALREEQVRMSELGRRTQVEADLGAEVTRLVDQTQVANSARLALAATTQAELNRRTQVEADLDAEVIRLVNENQVANSARLAQAATTQSELNRRTQVEADLDAEVIRLVDQTQVANSARLALAATTQAELNRRTQVEADLDAEVTRLVSENQVADSARLAQAATTQAELDRRTQVEANLDAEVTRLVSENQVVDSARFAATQAELDRRTQVEADLDAEVIRLVNENQVADLARLALAATTQAELDRRTQVEADLDAEVIRLVNETQVADLARLAQVATTRAELDRRTQVEADLDAEVIRLVNENVVQVATTQDELNRRTQVEANLDAEVIRLVNENQVADLDRLNQVELDRIVQVKLDRIIQIELDRLNQVEADLETELNRLVEEKRLLEISRPIEEERVVQIELDLLMAKGEVTRLSMQKRTSDLNLRAEVDRLTADKAQDTDSWFSWEIGIFLAVFTMLAIGMWLIARR
jgi:hypothetical protein